VPEGEACPSTENGSCAVGQRIVVGEFAQRGHSVVILHRLEAVEAVAHSGRVPSKGLTEPPQRLGIIQNTLACALTNWAELLRLGSFSVPPFSFGSLVVLSFLGSCWSGRGARGFVVVLVTPSASHAALASTSSAQRESAFFHSSKDPLSAVSVSARSLILLRISRPPNLSLLAARTRRSGSTSRQFTASL